MTTTRKTVTVSHPEQDGASHADHMEDDVGIVKASTATNTTTTVAVSTTSTSNQNDDGNNIPTDGNAVKIVHFKGKRRIIEIRAEEVAEAKAEEEDEEEEEQEQEQEEPDKDEETNVCLDEDVSIFKASNATNTTTKFAVSTTSATNKNDDGNNITTNDNTGKAVAVG